MKAKYLFTTLLLIAMHCSYGQYQKFADSYSILSTIAGKGEIDNAGEVGWSSSFENGNAIDAELTRPHFAMADSVGNVYIADKDAHGIRKVSPEGIISTIAGTNVAGDNGANIGIECQLHSPNGLWVKWDGTVYILDLGNNKIRRLNLDGSIETIVDDTAGYALGRGLWVSKTEDSIFYASASEIKIWTKQHGIATYCDGFSALGNICMDKNDYLIATDRNANLVYRISKDGNSKEIIAGNGDSSGGGDGDLATETGLHGVRGVWFIDDNSYFVATHEGSQIWYIDVVGRIHLFLNGKKGDEYHTGDGEDYRTPGYKISEARSVSVDYQGNLLITENDYGYIRKIQNDYTYYYTNIINQEITEGFSIVPNPACGNTTIKINQHLKGNAKLCIYNSFGKIVYHEEPTNNTIKLNTQDLPNGLYFCTLNADHYSITKKLVVQH